jgi:hypothetical protein
MEVIGRLQTIEAQRKARLEYIVKWAIASARSLKEGFDEYVNKEITEMKEILTMMGSLQREVDEERDKVRQLEIQYLRVNDELNDIIDSANRNKIKRIDFNKPDKQPPNYSYTSQYVEGPFPKEGRSSEIVELDIWTIMEAFDVVGGVDDLRQRIDRLSRNYMRGVRDIESVVKDILKKERSGGTS